ncbi:MAG: arginine--tRNA ligase [Armatimonadetes bacterium]|nr:arginine--tRNA ligase [Armatimonadota bacterium]
MESAAQEVGLVLRDELHELLKAAIERAIEDGQFPPQAREVAFALDTPPRPELGDFSSNAALVLAKTVRQAPRQVAEAIVQRLGEHELVEKVEIAGPGFINFHLAPAWLESAVAQVLEQGEEYGRSDWGEGRAVQVEYVSANPVGPLHIGNARGGPYGDVVANLLEATGHQVQREYYINDGPANTQVQVFGASVQARYLELLGEDVTFPKEGYQGEYVTDLAMELVGKYGDKYRDVPRDAEGAYQFFQLLADRMVEMLQQDCEALGLHFDVWFSESSLGESGTISKVVALLQERGAAYEADGAVWLKATEFGDEEDRVLVRSNGATTYIASDAAYAYNKFIERDFEHVIYVWGPDHAGYIPRLKAAVAALGVDPDHAEIIIYQTVRFLRGGEPLRLSKRRGAIVPIREIVEEIGLDATRFFFLLRSVDAHLDFDLDLAKQKTEENPVYYVQYAHARICSLQREAETRGFEQTSSPRLELLTDPAERDLMRAIMEYPRLVSGAARDRAPHRLTHFAVDLARRFHQFYDRCRVLAPEEPELSQARLALAQATAQVLRNLLGLLGVEAPESM